MARDILDGIVSIRTGAAIYRRALIDYPGYNSVN